MKTSSREIVITALALLPLWSCSKNAGEPPGEAAIPAKERHDPYAEKKHSDLDRPVEELFAATCEHRQKTHQCDECRYEVGVVKAPAILFEGGLLKVTKAERRRIAVPLDLTGEVQFDDRRVVQVSSPTEGIIRKVQATLGDKVKRGQALIEIDSAAVGEAQAAYLEAQGMFKLARRNHERLAALRQEGISSEKELLHAEQELDAAEIRADAALGKLIRLGMDVGVTRSVSQVRSTGRLVLRAPAEGTVLELHAVPGEVVKSAESLATVGDNTNLWVWADLYERDVAVVTSELAKQPLAASIAVKAFPGEDFPGVVDFISPSLSRPSRTVKLRLAVPNPGGRLFAGMFAVVKVFLPGEAQGLAVPRSTVLEDEGRWFVFVHHQGDYYVRRPIAPGRIFAGWVEITQGLKGDESIVDDGAFLLKSDVLRSKMGAGCAD